MGNTGYGEPAPLSFRQVLERWGAWPLVRARTTTLQVNLGRRCNLSCAHCHQQAGPEAPEVLTEAVADRLLQMIRTTSELETVDLTGGAPELCPSVERLVRGGRAAGREVIVRTNLAILAEPGFERWLAFYADQGVHLLGSLPATLPELVDQQRGPGAFQRSIDVLQELNAIGYGQAQSGLLLDLVVNPVGAELPADPQTLERAYRHDLARRWGVTFNSLIVITNVPVGRFGQWLHRQELRDHYLRQLVERMNPETLPQLSCQHQLCVAWDGTLYACDFNLGARVPERSLRASGGAAVPERSVRASGAATIFELSRLDEARGRPIATGVHCFACTAAAGSG